MTRSPNGSIPFLLGLLLLGGALAPRPAHAAEEPIAENRAGVEFFEKKIRPVLADRCYLCHGSGAKKVRGGLRLDTAGAFARGGDSGPAIVPGEPDKSLLIKAIRYTDPDLQMPPKKGKLPKAHIEDLTTWIRM